MKSDFINCKNCTDDCHCKGKNITPICLSFKPAKITNADHIRGMSDEELAEYLAPCACPPIRFNKNTGDIVCPVNKEPCESDCKHCWLDWLKEEAKDD